MKHLIILILLFPFIGYSLPSDSLDIIDISKISNNHTKILPFDRPFYIKVPVEKGGKLVGLDIYKKNSRGKYAKFSNIERKRMEAIYGKYNVSEYIYKEGKKKIQEPQIYIHLTEEFLTTDKNFHYIKIFPLNPATDYEFKMIYLKSEKLRNSLLQALNSNSQDVYYNSLLEKLDLINDRYYKLDSEIGEDVYEKQRKEYTLYNKKGLNWKDKKKLCFFPY